MIAVTRFRAHRRPEPVSGGGSRSLIMPGETVVGTAGRGLR